MSKKAKQTYFKDTWLTSSEFSRWITRSTIKTEVGCKLCKINFGLSNMGVTALKSHSQSKGHQKLVKEKDSCELFAVMFPDSKIASQIELGRMKLKYMVNFGLGPHFRDVLKCETAASDWYSISFDDSLNKVVQECEMDILI